MLDRARRAGAPRFVHVSSNSPFGANPTRRRPLHRGLAVRPVHGLRALEARGRAARAAQPRPRRPRDRHRAAAVVLRPVPARPADAVLRGGPPGPVPARRRRARSGGRWCTRATSSHGLLRAEARRRRAPGAAYWIADAEPYELRDDPRRRCATRSRPRGSPCRRAGRCRVPRGRRRGRRRKLDGARCRRAGRYVQALHVLGELKDTIACDITRARDELGYEPAGRAVRRHAGERPLVPRARAARSDGAHDPDHRRQRLLRHRCSPSRRWPRGDAVRDLRPEPARRAERAASSSSRATCATATRCAPRATGVDVVLHNVAQVPLAKDRDLFDVGERRRDRERARRGARRAASRRSCTRRRARSSGSRSTTR